MQKRILSMLALLITAVTGAWADQLASSYSSNATLNEVTVSASMEVTIATGVTVTINNGLNITSGTLTVKGPGTLVVNGKAGSNGSYNDDGDGGPGGNGGVAITGNIIVQGGATVKATGGNGGNGGNSEAEDAGNGAQGGAAITGEVTIQDASTLEATGGNGGNGGTGVEGGNGGNGGVAFAGTMTYKGGTVTATGGAGGSGGSGEMENGSGGYAGKAFATSVNFVSSDYILTDGSNAITATQVTSKKKVVISPKIAVNSVTLAPTSATLTLGETETVTLTATIDPTNAMDPTVKWNVTAGADKVKLYKDENCSTEVGTAATDVFTVYAKGLAVGEATVTVTSNDDATKTAACTVTVIPTGYSVSLKSGTEDAASWQGKAGTGDYQSMPLTGLEASTAVSVKYSGTKMVKSVKARKKKAAITDLSTISADYEAKNGETLTGTLANNVKISIADGATVTLKDVNITNLGNSCNWAGINCPGDATLVLEGTNEVCAGRGGDYGMSLYPGIWIAPNKTLTIQGAGNLTAYSGGPYPDYPYSAGIGGGFGISCGNIVINSGTITATGGLDAAGIGGGGGTGSCGYITISGGTVEATGGGNGAGIGGGYGNACGNITISGGTVSATGGDSAAGIGGGSMNGVCGNITIKSTVTSVTATKGGQFAPYSIGRGYNGTAITVTIEDGANVTQN